MDLNSVSANGTLETTFVTADTRTKKRSKKKTKKDQKLGTARLDLVFLVIFPLLFFLFNLIYWYSFIYFTPESALNSTSPDCPKP